MSQTNPRPRVLLQPTPRQALSPDQQLEALRRVQAQAEQRVKLGQQLFKAAEARVSTHRAMIDEIKGEQAKLRDEVQRDVAQSLQSYDQWVGKLDERLTEAMRSLEARLDTLQNEWQATQAKIEHMLRRSEALLDQSRVLLGHEAPAVEPESPLHDKPAPKAQGDVFSHALKRLEDKPGT